MVHLIFRHITGVRATQTDVVPMSAHRELILGRAPSAAVRFDPRGDTVVGRYHARIVPAGLTSPDFVISDLASANGTFVNGKRIVDRVRLRSGDVVQLGKGGPLVEVRLDIGDVELG